MADSINRIPKKWKTARVKRVGGKVLFDFSPNPAPKKRRAKVKVAKRTKVKRARPAAKKRGGKRRK